VVSIRAGGGGAMFFFRREVDYFSAFTRRHIGANSFDYLTELQRHAQKLATSPTEWMPWNYHETLQRIVSLSDSA